MDRRAFVAMVAGSTVAAPLAAEAQRQEAKVHRIGFLATPVRAPINIDAFRRGLLEHGHAEGRNLLIEARSAEGRDERLPALAAELVGLKVEAIVTEGPSATLAAKKATTEIPIVFTFVPDPVALELELGRLLDGQVGGLRTLEDFIDQNLPHAVAAQR